MTVRVLLVHHDANSRAGLVGEALVELGAALDVHQVCATPGSLSGRTTFPEPTGYDAVVLFGSRWSVDDAEAAHWVLPELQMLRRADAEQVPVLGLCFGAQLLSAAHGGAVERTPRPELGWYEVSPRYAGVAELDAGAGAGTAERAGSATGPVPVPSIEPGPWLQWHFDRFSVPDGAHLLAESPAGPQAFVLRRNLAVQFHPEADRAVLEGWFDDDLDQVHQLGVDPDVLLADTDRHLAGARRRARRLVDAFLELAHRPPVL